MKRVKLIKWGMLTASSVLLAACGGGTEQTPPAEQPADTATQDTTAPETGDTSVGTGDTSQDTSQEGGAAGNNQPNTTQQGINNMTFDTSLDDAIQTFNEEFNNPNIESIHFDEEDGRHTYDFEGFDDTNEYSLEIDAQSGEVLNREQESENDDDNDDVLNLEGIISPEEAMSIAAEEAGSGHVEEWELDVENGTTVYEIDMEGTDGAFDDDDLRVNAQTGEILNQ